MNMMRFSERIGAVERVIQLQTMTPRLKNLLWNVAYRIFWDELKSNQETISEMGDVNQTCISSSAGMRHQLAITVLLSVD